MTGSAKVFSTIGLVGKTDDPAVDDALRDVAGYLQTRGVDIIIDERNATPLPDLAAAALNDIARRADLVIIIGGDGTLLHTARGLAEYGVPIVGINRGRLGFLTDIGHDQVQEALARILDGDFEEDPRFMLDTELRNAAGEGLGDSRALNDVVIHKWNTARMIEFEIWINGRFVDAQRSDGLIISTPTGSTAYALSGGGPLVCPNLNAILLVPICPHTLGNRPIVVGGDDVLELRVSERNENGHVHITCDGQNSFVLSPDDKVTIRKAARPVRLLHPTGYDHFDILRNKLRWGGQRH